jgi:DeoR family transcriptional regulator, aga operon transcriptional repressor
MLAEQRRQQILIELQRIGQARTRQLADLFDVSEVTIRSDLDIMDGKKLLIKTHGGAIALPADSPAAAFEERMQRNFDAKRRIAQMAARQIIDNQSIVFDSGSTLLQLAMQMPPVKNVVVATTAMNIAQHLMYRPGLDVHMIGGRVFPSTVSTIVSDSDKALGGLVAHQAFVSAHAIDSSWSTSPRTSPGPSAILCAWRAASFWSPIPANGTSARPRRHSPSRASISSSPTATCRTVSGTAWKSSASKSATPESVHGRGACSRSGIARRGPAASIRVCATSDG